MGRSTNFLRRAGRSGERNSDAGDSNENRDWPEYWSRSVVACYRYRFGNRRGTAFTVTRLRDVPRPRRREHARARILTHRGFLGLSDSCCSDEMAGGRVRTQETPTVTTGHRQSRRTVVANASVAKRRARNYETLDGHTNVEHGNTNVEEHTIRTVSSLSLTRRPYLAYQFCRRRRSHSACHPSYDPWTTYVYIYIYNC